MSTSTTLEPRWISRRAAAKRLGISEQHLARLGADGELTTRRVGRGWEWFRQDEIDELDRHAVKPRRKPVSELK